MVTIHWLLLAALLAPAGRPERMAPFPPGWQSDYDDADKAGYVSPPRVRGLYGHGTYDSDGARFIDPADAGLCKGDEAARIQLAQRAGRMGSEFWLYATGHQAILFKRSIVVDSAKPCAEALSSKYLIERGFAADGLIHLMAPRERGTWDVESVPAAPADPNYFYLRDPLYNALARIPPPKEAGRPSTETVADLPAQCWHYATLVFYEICFSEAAGRSKGMVLSSRSGDDAGMDVGLSFDLLDETTQIDGRLFEMERRWWFPK